MAAVSSGVNARRSKMTRTIGDASAIRPTVAGTFNIIISVIPSAIVRRMPARSFCAACRDTAGIAAVAIDTPNSPIGRYIRRNA